MARYYVRCIHVLHHILADDYVVSCCRLKLTPSSGWLKDCLCHLQPRLHECTLLQLQSLLQAVAHWRTLISKGNQTAVVTQIMIEVQQQLMAQACRQQVDALASAAHTAIPCDQPVMRADVSCRVLAGILRAAVQLRHDPSQEWMESYLTAVNANLQECTAADLASILLSLAKLNYSPPAEQLQAMLAQHHLIPIMNASQLAVTLHALAKLHATPDEYWIQLVYKRSEEVRVWWCKDRNTMTHVNSPCSLHVVDLVQATVFALLFIWHAPSLTCC